VEQHNFDLITVGGGLGGSTLAKIMAEHGARVLVVERERQFSDRIRGEWIAPWGVAEAQRIGIYTTLVERCAHELPNLEIVGMGPPRNLRETTLQRLPGMTVYHPAMQEILLEVADRSGAEIWRGATVRNVCPGESPIALIERDGNSQKVTARLIACADGRSSASRRWGGFVPRREKQKLFGAGVLFENVATDEDTSIAVFDLPSRRLALLFPQGGGRVRAYLTYDPAELDRLQGAGDVSRFVSSSIQTGIPERCFADARAVGPLASFDMTESWVPNPYRDGIVLIGDAAGSSDPTWGQGLSITMRDVRELSENLLATDDWTLAGRRYAQARDVYFQTEVRVAAWLFEMFFGEGTAADRVRERAIPLLIAEPDRFPDHGFSGLDLPSDEQVRRRFFGEL
jgi:2-polyprenyl-6-methoxyphenol hydroxylase-like FAD-dependent oxidoreductase